MAGQPVTLQVAALSELGAAFTSEPIAECGQHASRPLIRDPHLFDVHAAVFYDEIAAEGDEMREAVQRGSGRLVGMR